MAYHKRVPLDESVQHIFAKVITAILSLRYFMCISKFIYFYILNICAIYKLYIDLKCLTIYIIYKYIILPKVSHCN